MHVQVNTDASIEGTEGLGERVKGAVEGTLARYAGRITRVEVHLSDENGERGGGADKRCVMEARVQGLRPEAVTHRAATLDDAIDGAAEKLERSIQSTLGRLDDR